MSEEKSDLPPAAQRALAEAEERRRLAEAAEAADPRPIELGGSKDRSPSATATGKRRALRSTSEAAPQRRVKPAERPEPRSEVKVMRLPSRVTSWQL